MKKLTHQEVSSLGGKSLKRKYPKKTRSRWARKAALARWHKRK